MKKTEIIKKLKDLDLELKNLSAEIQKEREEDSSEENATIEELMLKQSVVEKEIESLNKVLESDKQFPNIEYIVEFQGTKKTFKIVHEQFADSSRGMISENSPLAKSLIKVKEGKTFTIETPVGEATYKLISKKKSK